MAHTRRRRRQVEEEDEEVQPLPNPEPERRIRRSAVAADVQEEEEEEDEKPTPETGRGTLGGRTRASPRLRDAASRRPHPPTPILSAAYLKKGSSGVSVSLNDLDRRELPPGPSPAAKKRD